MGAYDKLHEAAQNVIARAYAPYSKFPVAAAALDTNGVVHTGVNIENASFGLTQCAEGTLLGAWRLAAGAPLSHLVCINAAGEYITPCGRCRQMLMEHATGDLSIATKTGPVQLAQLLPYAFGPTNLQDT